jgi:tRNA threonylcarbamoyladenosine biosynthesis protein TsaE
LNGVHLLQTRRETLRLAAQVARVLVAGDLLVLSGDLGAGKTFFLRAVARALGVRGPVTSPTFTLVNEYALPMGGVLVHADVYRLLGSEATALRNEVHQLGLRERRSEGAIVAAEWGDDVVGALGGGMSLRVELSIEGSHVRKAAISGPRGDGLLR